MRLLALGCVLLASTAAFAQTPAPDDEPRPTEPAPAPQQPPPAEPAPQPPSPTKPAPAPPPPSAIPPAPYVDKRTATQQRLAAQAICARRDPTCDWMATLSSLERNSVRRALADLALDPEPSPWGKVIGEIRIYNEDVFAEQNWLSFLNFFHITTREATIRRELTIDEGEVWDDERVAESARRLKDPLYTSVVAILPTKAALPNEVDLLVVTRDIWSLRLNTQYQIQQNTLTNLSISLSENNFLGRRKVLALAMLMDQGAISVGPLFIDKNFLGQHVDFRVRAARILTRQSLDAVDTLDVHMPTGDPGGLQDERVFRAEGSEATVQMTKTLWSLASTWGGGGSFSWRNAISRSYRSTGLRAIDDPDTPDEEFLAREYRMRTWTARASVIRQWGSAYKHQVEAGHSVTSQTPSLLPNFPADPALQTFFIDAVFPRTELISSPFVEYGIFRATFRTIRNVDTYELAEDLRTGPNLTVGLQESLKLLGSDYHFTRPSIQGGWTQPVGSDGFVRVSAGGQLRIQKAPCTLSMGVEETCRTIDNTATAQIRGVTPTVMFMRLVAQVHFETRWHDTQNAYYILGSDSGLRGYNIGQFIGNRRVVGQLEARSVPWPVWVFRAGGVVFYEVGGTAASFNHMVLYQDVGLGLRMLIPQTSRELFRFDLAFPLVATESVPAGHPRFLAGFDSYF